MPSADEAERRIREMLIEMGDDELLARFDGAVKAFDERDQRISETLDELLKEVDELLLRVDAIENVEGMDSSSEDEPEELC